MLPKSNTLRWPTGNTLASAGRRDETGTMSDIPRSLIEQLHASPWRTVLAITGGGSAAIAELASVPGASATLLEATVPYAEAALAAYLWFTPESACSEATTRALAMAAFQRGRKLTGDHEALIGLGATASLASTRPKRGAHRVHIAWQSAIETGVNSLTLTKGARDRPAEEALTTAFIIHTLLTACDLATPPPETLPTDIFTMRTTTHPEWSPLLAGQSLPCAAAPPALLLPGAFNPPHAGHHEMAAYAATRYGRPVTYELSVTNVDKPPLDFLEIESRLAQLPEQNVWLTCAPPSSRKCAWPLAPRLSSAPTRSSASPTRATTTIAKRRVTPPLQNSPRSAYASASSAASSATTSPPPKISISRPNSPRCATRSPKPTSASIFRPLR